MSETKPIKRLGQPEMRIIDLLPVTKDVHLTYEVSPTGNIYDPHITKNLPGGKKLSTK